MVYHFNHNYVPESEGYVTLRGPDLKPWSDIPEFRKTGQAGWIFRSSYDGDAQEQLDCIEAKQLEFEKENGEPWEFDSRFAQEYNAFVKC